MPAVQRLRRLVVELTSRLAPRGRALPRERRILELLAGSPMTSRELAARSGVPRDQLYELLGTLYDRRAVLTAPDGLFWSAVQESTARRRAGC